MRKLLIVFWCLLLQITAFNQAPQSFNYQAVVRSSSQWLLSNQDVDVRINLKIGNTSGIIVYTETHSTTTNLYGLINLNIGAGTVVLGDFDAIDWGADDYFINVEVTTDGTNYLDMGTTQILSVPYALYALKAANVVDTSTTNELQSFHVNGDTLFISGGNYVILSGVTIYIPDTTYDCGDPFVDPRDGQSYNTVLIYGKCWMAENMNYDNGSTTNSWCFQNDPANCETYGRLYTWDAAMNACPSGWHLASDSDWAELVDDNGGLTLAGGPLKQTGTWEAGTGLWNTPNTGATNASGFTALPSGYREYQAGWFGLLHQQGYFWTSTQHNATWAWMYSMTNGGAYVNRPMLEKLNGLAVRCKKN
jgi:uncharacterized protein (TIGR02145 family)